MVWGNEEISYEGIKIRVVDVFVIHTLDREGCVVHRVVTNDSRGIRTRGDNNNTLDLRILCPDDILDRVNQVKRKNKNKTLYGGLLGRINVSGIRMIKQVDLIVSKTFHSVYNRLSKSGCFRKVLHQQIKPQVLCFRRSNFTEMHLLMGMGKTNGLFDVPSVCL